MPGPRGTFEVHVDGRLVAKRKGGLIALATRRPWPETDALVADVTRALGNSGEPTSKA